MFAEGALATPPVDSEIALIVALGVEHACFADRFSGRDSGHRVALIQAGPGAANTARAVAAALDRRAAGLISCGLAGALSRAAQPGDVVLPAAVVGANGSRFAADPAWRARIAASLTPRFNVIGGDLLAAEAVLGTRTAKLHAARASGAVAADLESGTAAALAQAAGVPFVALRVVADAADDDLPTAIETWVDAAGRSRMKPVAKALVTPVQWAPLWTLVRRYRVARRTLSAVARTLPADLSFGA